MGSFDGAADDFGPCKTLSVYPGQNGGNETVIITDALFWPETDGDLPLPATGDEPADGLLLDDDGFYGERKIVSKYTLVFTD